MSGKSYKLGQIATELNISTQTLAQDLQKLGYAVEPSPIARVSAEAYEALMRHYGKAPRSASTAEKAPPPPDLLPEEKELPTPQLPIVGKAELPPPKRRLPSIKPTPPPTPPAPPSGEKPPLPPAEEAPTSPPVRQTQPEPAPTPPPRKKKSRPRCLS